VTTLAVISLLSPLLMRIKTLRQAVISLISPLPTRVRTLNYRKTFCNLPEPSMQWDIRESKTLYVPTIQPNF
jgi:hypothetical protein